MAKYVHNNFVEQDNFALGDGVEVLTTTRTDVTIVVYGELEWWFHKNGEATYAPKRPWK